MTVVPDKISDRFSWALSIVRPGGADQILEVGCGSGLLVQRVAPFLATGCMVAVDRSASMIEAARKRNRLFTEQGKVRLHQEAYTPALFGPHTFDKAIAFNVSAFWQSPEEVLPAVRMHLKAKGRFYLLHQPPFDKTKALAGKAEQALRHHHFAVEEIVVAAFHPAPAFCIVSRPG